jgi:hypothetical protein
MGGRKIGSNTIERYELVYGLLRRWIVNHIFSTPPPSLPFLAPLMFALFVLASCHLHIYPVENVQNSEAICSISDFSHSRFPLIRGRLPLKYSKCKDPFDRADVFDSASNVLIACMRIVKAAIPIRLQC